MGINLMALVRATGLIHLPIPDELSPSGPHASQIFRNKTLNDLLQVINTYALEIVLLNNYIPLQPDISNLICSPILHFIIFHILLDYSLVIQMGQLLRELLVTISRFIKPKL